MNTAFSRWAVAALIVLCTVPSAAAQSLAGVVIASTADHRGCPRHGHTGAASSSGGAPALGVPSRPASSTVLETDARGRFVFVVPASAAGDGCRLNVTSGRVAGARAEWRRSPLMASQFYGYNRDGACAMWEAARALAAAALLVGTPVVAQQASPTEQSPQPPDAFISVNGVRLHYFDWGLGHSSSQSPRMLSSVEI
jgi:hypothetical protein